MYMLVFVVLLSLDKKKVGKTDKSVATTFQGLNYQWMALFIHSIP